MKYEVTYTGEYDLTPSGQVIPSKQTFDSYEQALVEMEEWQRNTGYIATMRAIYD